MVQVDLIELEGVIIEQITNRVYRVKLISSEFNGTILDINQSGASYYDGIKLYNGDKVAIDYRRSTPDKSQITYRL